MCLKKVASWFIMLVASNDSFGMVKTAFWQIIFFVNNEQLPSSWSLDQSKSYRTYLLRNILAIQAVLSYIVAIQCVDASWICISMNVALSVTRCQTSEWRPWLARSPSRRRNVWMPSSAAGCASWHWSQGDGYVMCMSCVCNVSYAICLYGGFLL